MAATQHSSTKQDILEFLLKQGQATAQDLADHLEISPQAVRRHLKDLENDDLIEHQVIHTGLGRPNHLYGLSAQGRSQFPAQYDEFAISLLDTLAETVGQEQVGTILEKQWQRKGLDYRRQIGEGDLPDRVAKLVQLRQKEGYMAEWHRAEAIAGDFIPNPLTETPERFAETTLTDAPRFIITEYNCAISQIAESFPSVCGHELQMFELALGNCAVTRTHWIVNGEHRCGYLIQPRAEASQAS